MSVMKKNKVSIIIVTWNVENIIEKCLESLFKYADLDNEIIIVDNASSDNTCAIIKNRFNDQVKLIELQENIGFSKANNVGVNVCSGEYVFFLNPDVIFIQPIMKEMKRILDNENEIGIVSPKLLNIDKSLQISYGNFPSLKSIIYNEFKLGALLSKKYKRIYYQAKVREDVERYVDWTYGAAHFCKYEDVKKIGLYPDSYFMYGEDTEICMKFLKVLGKKVYYMPKLELIHIGGYSEKQVVNSKKVIYVTNAQLYFLKKYFGESKMQLARALLIINRCIKIVIVSFISLFSNSQVLKNKKYKFKVQIKTLLRCAINK